MKKVQISRFVGFIFLKQPSEDICVDSLCLNLTSSRFLPTKILCSHVRECMMMISKKFILIPRKSNQNKNSEILI